MENVILTYYALRCDVLPSHTANPPPHRVVYEGPQIEYDADGVATEEDVIFYFRVAAVNAVGIGPYSVSVSYTKKKACEPCNVFWHI